jgi:CO/xanthine dehydrogenase Mo-binding subunit
MVTQFAIEPHAFMAAPDGDGVVIWSSIQHPYWLQKIMAEILRLPLAKVRVLAPDPGGAFGGKQHTKFEPLVALMALRAGRPARLIFATSLAGGRRSSRATPQPTASGSRRSAGPRS